MFKNKNKQKEYLQAIIMFIILVIIIFAFDLPKTNFIIIGIIAIFIVFLFEVFGIKRNDENMSGRKRNYIGAITFFVFFAIIIFIFDAPKKAYAIIGIIVVSNILLYEIFNFGNKSKK
ncbi:hypothetical protein [Lentibacillus juripiscarius]|uniref:Permease n=1 Tax=Lentibacillus juripiscarius TaxID=257446 RepID=A0ABW5VAE2_9BACI